ncbi:helix-turn-helix domain-containing protein [Amycolatopsis acidicola]|uniref:Helix-turn-helix domain-containing protein n=1 Tax=Amycolatopsis acidicola TaxID=2596893 RepID=A0A5N0VBU3_9PSEU|nr:helix-turn-helix domain-containing protein [Amycolatopsis acidicola]KAA9162600.1 helix-turn-helix domain-containing protein [Amycolatopsis acidicola]
MTANTYSIRAAAWILGVDPDRIARAIRLGTLRATRRNGQLVIPAVALVRLLDRGAA